MYPYNNNLTKLLHSNSPRGFYCATDFIEMFHLFLVKGGDCCKLLSFAHSKKLDWFTNQDRNESNMMQLLAGCGLDLSGHYHTPLIAQTILIRFEYSHHWQFWYFFRVHLVIAYLYVIRQIFIVVKGQIFSK